MESESLVLYDEMRVAIARCAEIDEAAKIRDVSARLEAYARIHDDTEAQQKFAEIRLRAFQKIGELSRQLEKMEGFKGNQHQVLPSDGKKQTKEQALAEAGISTSTANRAEQIAPSEPVARAVAAEAMDNYFTQTRTNGEVPNIKGFEQTIRSALVEVFGEPPKRKKKLPKEEIDHRFINFIGPIRDFQRRRDEYDPEFFAEEEMEFIAKSDVEGCEDFIEVVRTFITETKKRFNHVFRI
jgi:tryptophan 2,3-dioxygenase